MNDAMNYLYQHDPNFDFDNRDVSLNDTTQKTIRNKHKITRYYQEPEMEEEKEDSLNNSFTSFNSYNTDNVKEPLYFYDIEEKKRRSDNTNNRPRRKPCSDYNLTKTCEAKIEPAKMKVRPKYKLKTV